MKSRKSAYCFLDAVVFVMISSRLCKCMFGVKMADTNTNPCVLSNLQSYSSLRQEALTLRR